MPRPCGEALGAKLRVGEQASARVCARRRASLWVAARDRALRVASAGMTGLQVFEDAFPVISERTSLELVEARLREDDAVILRVRLFVWDVEGESRMVRDIKEQDVFVGTATMLQDPRLAACVGGWRLAIEQLFAQDDPRWFDDVACAMPDDLIKPFSQLLALKRPRDAEDFAEALLASKPRLGRYLRT